MTGPRRIIRAGLLLGSAAAASVAHAGCPDPEGSEPFRMIAEDWVETVDRSARPVIAIERRMLETGAVFRGEAFEGLLPLDAVGVTDPSFSRQVTYHIDPAALFPLVAGAEHSVSLTRVTRQGAVQDVSRHVIIYRVLGPTRIEIGDCAYDAIAIEQDPEQSQFSTPILQRQVFVPGLGIVAAEIVFPQGEMPPEGWRVHLITTDLTEGLP